MPLSVKQVEAAKPIWDKAKQKWRENRLADGEQLYLVAQKREKTWRMRYYYGGVERNLTIGHFPEMTLAEARQKNRYYRGKLDEGHDPAEVMKQNKGAIVAAVMEERRIAKGEVHPDSLGAIAEDWLLSLLKALKGMPPCWHPFPKRTLPFIGRNWPAPDSARCRSGRLSNAAPK